MKKYLPICFVLLHLTLTIFAQGRKVTGTITDVQNGQPLAGVSIQVKNQKGSAITGPDGRFTITVPPGKATLELSYVGYKSQTVSLDPGENTLTLALEPGDNQLESVVFTALGIKKE